MSLKSKVVNFLVKTDLEGRKAYQDDSDIRSAASLAASWKASAAQNHLEQYFPVANFIKHSVEAYKIVMGGTEYQQPPQGESKNARVFFNQVGSVLSTTSLVVAPWVPIALPLVLAHSAARGTLATWNGLQGWAHRQVEKDPQSYVVNWS